jgi:hypothetical protein
VSGRFRRPNGLHTRRRYHDILVNCPARNAHSTNEMTCHIDRQSASEDHQPTIRLFDPYLHDAVSSVPQINLASDGSHD